MGCENQVIDGNVEILQEYMPVVGIEETKVSHFACYNQFHKEESFILYIRDWVVHYVLKPESLELLILCYIPRLNEPEVSRKISVRGL